MHGGRRCTEGGREGRTDVLTKRLLLGISHKYVRKSSQQSKKNPTSPIQF